MRVCVGFSGVTKYIMKVCVMNGYLCEMGMNIGVKRAISVFDVKNFV